MAETPKHDIEKLLNDYAKQRRDAAGTPEMHPATRCLLHAEVKQHHGTARPAASQTPAVWWKRLWPRIAVACAILSALGVAVVLTVSPGGKSANQFTLAKMTETKSETDRMPPPAIAPSVEPVAPAPSALVRRETVGKSGAPTSRSVATPVVAEAQPRDALRGNIETETRFKGGVAAKGGNYSTSSAAPAMAPGTASAMTGDRQADLLDKYATQRDRSGGELQINSTQVFRNMASVEKPNSTTTLPVLDEFKFEQNGSVLTVVDGDGSVYKGYVRPIPATDEGGYLASSAPNQTTTSRSLAMDDSKPMKNAGQPQAAQIAPTASLNVAQSAQVQGGAELQNYVFRVEGTNRSLNQRVIFTGNLLQNSLVESSQNRMDTRNFKQQAVQQNINNAADGLQMQNNFINGRVQLGTNKTSAEFNALSVER